MSKNHNRKQTTLNLITGVLSLVMNLGVSFVLSSYIVRTIGEEANGFTQLANNFVLYVSLITIAFNSMATRFISLSYHKGEDKKVSQYYSSILFCNILITLILIPCAVFVVFSLDQIVNIDTANVTHVKILFACVFVNFFISLFSSVFEISTFVLNKLYLKNIIYSVRSILNAVLLFCTFYLFTPKIYYVSLVALILSVLLLILMYIIQMKLMPSLKLNIHDFKFGIIKELTFSGIWNVVNQGGNLLMTGMDLLLSNLFISPIMMGVLAVAKTVPNAIFNLAGTLNANFAPELMITYSQGKKSEMLKQLRSSMKISGIIISIPIITFCSFGIPFYTLWMPTLDAKMLTILSFLACMAFIPWVGPQTLYNVFTTFNKLKVNSVAFFTTGIINIIIVYFLLKYTGLGIFAIAGVSSTITIFRNLIITAPYTAKLLGLKWYEFYKDVIVSLICCGICAVVCFIFNNLIMINNWFSLIAVVMLCCLFTLIIDITIILNKSEKQAFLKLILRRR